MSLFTFYSLLLFSLPFHSFLFISFLSSIIFLPLQPLVLLQFFPVSCYSYIFLFTRVPQVSQFSSFISSLPPIILRLLPQVHVLLLHLSRISDPIYPSFMSFPVFFSSVIALSCFLCLCFLPRVHNHHPPSSPFHAPFTHSCLFEFHEFSFLSSLQSINVLLSLSLPTSVQPLLSLVSPFSITFHIFFDSFYLSFPFRSFLSCFVCLAIHVNSY